MNNDNRKIGKNPVLKEIEEEDTPEVVEVPTVVSKGDSAGVEEDPEIQPDPALDAILVKNPEDLTAAEMDVLSDNKDDLTDEQKVKYGLADKELLGPEEEPVVVEKEPEVAPIVQVDQLAEQRREAQILAAQNKKLTDTINKAATLGEPTLDELITAARIEGADWDTLSDFEKAMFKKTYVSEKKMEIIHSATNDINKINEWAEKVDTFIGEQETKQEYKELSGHEAEFRKFAMTESHRGLDITLLADAFLNKVPEVQKKKGSLFPIGGGSPPSKPKTDAITDPEQAASLRTSNPREYARKVRAGKIKIEV